MKFSENRTLGRSQRHMPTTPRLAPGPSKSRPRPCSSRRVASTAFRALSQPGPALIARRPSSRSSRRTRSRHVTRPARQAAPVERECSLGPSESFLPRREKGLGSTPAAGSLDVHPAGPAAPAPVRHRSAAEIGSLFRQFQAQFRVYWISADAFKCGLSTNLGYWYSGCVTAAVVEWSSSFEPLQKPSRHI